MATQAEVRDQIFAALEAWRDANLAGMPIAWENVDFDPKTSDKSVGFLRPAVAFAGGTNTSLGNRHLRRLGTVIVQIFTDVDDGSGRADTVAESITEFLATLPQGAAGIFVRDPGVTTVGPDGVWYQQKASATIQFDSYFSSP